MKPGLSDAPPPGRRYLWLTRWAPYPPRRGGDVDYSRELVQSLARITPVLALAFADGDDAPPVQPGLTWRFVDHKEPPRLASLLSPLPNVAFRHLSRDYLAAVIEEARTSDAVFIDFISLFWLIAPLRKAMAGWPRAPLVIPVNHNVEHDVRRQMVEAETSLPLKAALALDTWKAGRLERQANLLADGVVANTPEDAQQFQRMTPRPVESVMPGYAGRRVESRTISAATPERICILGNHEAHHKRMVLQQTLAALAAAGLEHRYQIDVVGAGDNREFETRYPGFNYKGHIDDLGAYLDTVRFGLIPDEIGGGFKHRGLTHAFQRIPMLAVRSAVQGMGLSANEHYVEARDLQDMARMIPLLMPDLDRLNAIQEAAFDHCVTAFDWDQRGRAMEAFVRRLRDPKS